MSLAMTGPSSRVIVDEEKGMKAYGEGLLAKGDSVAVNLQSNLAPVAVGHAWLSRWSW